MSAPTGAAVFTLGTPKTLESSGASIANNALLNASTAYDRTTDGNDFTDLELVLAATFATAPTEGTTIAIYGRLLDIDGTGDTEVPETTRPTLILGQFVVNNVTSLQYMQAIIRNLPKLTTIYLYNNGTGQTISSGWTLKGTPRTVMSAP